MEWAPSVEGSEGSDRAQSVTEEDGAEAEWSEVESGYEESGGESDCAAEELEAASREDATDGALERDGVDDCESGREPSEASVCPSDDGEMEVELDAERVEARARPVSGSGSWL